MNSHLLAALPASQLWYAVPLVVVVSLVYAATRHERLGEILSHALGFGAMVVGFMAAIALVLLAISWFDTMIAGFAVVGLYLLLSFLWKVVKRSLARRPPSHPPPSNP